MYLKVCDFPQEKEKEKKIRKEKYQIKSSSNAQVMQEPKWHDVLTEKRINNKINPVVQVTAS